MRKWKEEGWDIRHILDYGLQLHATYMNNKSAPIPEGARAEVERFLRRLGYRLVIRSLEHEATTRAGEKLAVSITWKNVGVAPPYRDYRVAVRLTDQGEPTSKPIVLLAGESICGWLPGAHRTEVSLALPNTVTTGTYKLAVGVVDAVTEAPAVRLAIAGRDAEGWYPASRVEITDTR